MRNRILAAALEILRDEGAAGLNVRRVAELAGCSTTGIYTYFGGKHGLVSAIFVEGFESFDTALAPHHENGDLAGGIRTYRDWALANPMHYLVMFGRAVPDFDPGEEAIERAARSFRALIGSLARAGASEPTESALHLYATQHGYVMLELAGLAPPDLADDGAAYERGMKATIEQLLGQAPS